MQRGTENKRNVHDQVVESQVAHSCTSLHAEACPAPRPHAALLANSVAVDVHDQRKPGVNFQRLPCTVTKIGHAFAPKQKCC